MVWLAPGAEPPPTNTRPSGINRAVEWYWRPGVSEAAGVKDILAKSLGSPTHLNVAKATMDALLSQERPDVVAARRNKTPEEITPPGLLAAYRTAELGKAVADK